MSRVRHHNKSPNCNSPSAKLKWNVSRNKFGDVFFLTGASLHDESRGHSAHQGCDAEKAEEAPARSPNPRAEASGGERAVVWAAVRLEGVAGPFDTQDQPALERAHPALGVHWVQGRSRRESLAELIRGDAVEPANFQRSEANFAGQVHEMFDAGVHSCHLKILSDPLRLELLTLIMVCCWTLQARRATLLQ